MNPTTAVPQDRAALDGVLAALDHTATLLEDACRQVWTEQSSKRDSSDLVMAQALRDLRHEVRNPMGGMRGLAGLLARELEIRPSTANATRLLQALQQRVDLTSEVIERGTVAAGTLLDANPNDAAAAPAPVAADASAAPGPWRTVLWNLVRNAAEVGALGRAAALGATDTTALGGAEARVPAATPIVAPSDPIVTLLRHRGVSEALAETLGREARALATHPDDMAAALRRALVSALTPPRALDMLGRRSLLVIGSSGSGKTSTIAKVAADAVARGETPVLVCADGESLTGEDALSAVATALSLTVESAVGEGRLEQVVARCGAKRTYLVDTTGQSPEDPGALEIAKSLAHALEDPIILLVAAASTEADELRRLLEGFAPLGIDGLVITRLDEATRPGRLLDFARTIETPVAWVTFGRSARGAAAPPNDPRVISRILGTALAVERVA